MQSNETEQKGYFYRDEKHFYLALVAVTVLMTAAYFLGMPSYYLGWAAFSLAALSVAGNDAIQTVGTFIESKKQVHWLPKMAMLGLTLIAVFVYGWYIDDRQIHFERLKKFDEVTEFNLIQLLAPVVLLVITRLKAPVSTTFLILGVFGGGQNIQKMLTKSFVGYGVAFLAAIAVWAVLGYFDKQEYEEEHEDSEKVWSALQWFSTLFLWAAWLFQDSANIAVYLPRRLNVFELCGAAGIIVLALTYIIMNGGGKIQEVVSEKSDIKSAKAGTIVDIVYALILIIFQKWSNLPMSTTWVFLGLLAGRESILHIITSRDSYIDTFKKVGKDVALASLGIAVSISIFFLSQLIYPKPGQNFQILNEQKTDSGAFLKK